MICLIWPWNQILSPWIPDTPNKWLPKSKSNFYPVASRGKDLDLFQKMVEGDLTRLARNCHKKPLPDNLTLDERSALKNLTTDDSIVVRNADKGGTVVVLDAETYKQEALQQLSDPLTYQTLTCDPSPTFKTKLSALLNRAVQVGLFSPSDIELFIPAHPITPIFHHLPKVHKGTNPLTGRPIVAGIGSLNERLGEWVDSQL